MADKAPEVNGAFARDQNQGEMDDSAEHLGLGMLSTAEGQPMATWKAKVGNGEGPVGGKCSSCGSP